ncbi:MDR family MFS transporter [Paenibacillus sonchi]|uniref:MDR family MFS transporter n=1 Tax=Paenibacillus sonchi TaxID=373687 RepID=UPI001E3CE2E3|nr:MFS transporter [Paenibacillus sonchi]MCE3202742.1 MFS transporter [Paenibacillus sonchi]
MNNPANRKLNSKVWNILLGTLFTRTALFMSTPFLAIFLTTQKDISLLHTGYILSINPLINVLFGSFGGRLADKLSLKKIIGGIPLVWGSAFILFYFAGRFWHFLLLSGLNGLCYSIFEPASKKVLSAQTAPDNRLLVFNLRYSAINLGAFIGPLLSLLFNMKLTLFPYVILGILYILYGVSTRFFFRDMPAGAPASPPVPIRRPRAFTIIRKDHVFLLLLAGMSFSFFGYSQLNATVSQYLANTSALTNGVQLYSTLLSANALIILAAQFVLLRWISGWNPFTVVLVSNLLIGLSFLPFILPPAVLPLLAFIVLFSVGELLIGARFDALVDELARAEVKGLYFGCSELIKAGTIAGPLAGTRLLGHFGVQAGFPVFALLCAITITGAGLIGIAKSRHGSITHAQKPQEEYPA